MKKIDRDLTESLSLEEYGVPYEDLEEREKIRIRFLKNKQLNTDFY